MSGSHAKWQAERALVWWGAMMPHVKEPPDLETFAGYQPDKRAALKRCVEAWDKVDLALRRNRHGS
jgi:hypothetical protein